MRKALFLLLTLCTALFLCPFGYYVLEKDAGFQLSESRGPHNGAGVYLINLDRSQDRLAYVKPFIERLGLPFERISAVEGKLLSDLEIQSKVDFNSFRKYLNGPPNKGTIGCSLSHFQTWQRFLDSGFAYAVIFEDDVSFEPATLRLAIDHLIQKEDWDIAHLEVGHKGFPVKIGALPNKLDLVVYLTEVTHTGCYILNRKAAARLLEKALPIKMPVDHYFSRGWEFGLKPIGIENPRLVHQSYGTSEINQAVKEPRKRDIAQTMAYGLFKAQSFLIRLFYALKLVL